MILLDMGKCIFISNQYQPCLSLLGSVICFVCICSVNEKRETPVFANAHLH